MAASSSFISLVKTVKDVYSPLPTKYWNIFNGFQFGRTGFSELEATFLAKELVTSGVPSSTVRVLPENPAHTSFVVLVQNHGQKECSGAACDCQKVRCATLNP